MLTHKQTEIIRQELKYAYDEHIPKLLNLLDEKVKEVTPDSNGWGGIFDSYMEESNIELRRYGDDICLRIISVLKKMKIESISDEDKTGIISLVGNVIDPDLYTNRFNIFIEAVKRHLASMGLTFNKNKQLVPMNRALVDSYSKSQSKKIINKISHELDFFILNDDRVSKTAFQVVENGTKKEQLSGNQKDDDRLESAPPLIQNIHWYSENGPKYKKYCIIALLIILIPFCFMLCNNDEKSKTTNSNDEEKSLMLERLRLKDERINDYKERLQIRKSSSGKYRLLTDIELRDNALRLSRQIATLCKKNPLLSVEEKYREVYTKFKKKPNYENHPFNGDSILITDLKDKKYMEELNRIIPPENEEDRVTNQHLYSPNTVKIIHSAIRPQLDIYKTRYKEDVIALKNEMISRMPSGGEDYYWGHIDPENPRQFLIGVAIQLKEISDFFSGKDYK